MANVVCLLGYLIIYLNCFSRGKVIFLMKYNINVIKSFSFHLTTFDQHKTTVNMNSSHIHRSPRTLLLNVILLIERPMTVNKANSVQYP